MAEVTLEKVVKTFGKTEVLHGISTRIRASEFVVIVGPSGCGKSTLLRLIAGLEQVSAGQIAIDGRIVNELEPKDRDIAMVFQNYALYPHMSVFDNMAYGLKLRRVSREEIRQRVEQTAMLLQLEGLLDRKPRQLSGGQRQRVAMGRCIVRKPKVFLFDEPLSNLDAKLRVQMRLELRNLHETLKVTSVYVTHDQVEAMTLGDRLIVMKDGYAEQIGSPLAVYERPATRFVAGFIGSPAMNFLPVTIVDGGRTIRLSEDGDTRIHLARGLAHGRQAGTASAILGIRPEHIDLSTDAQSPLNLTVSSTEILGADTLVYGHLAETGAFLTIRLPDVHHVGKNTLLPLRIKPEKIHLFDAQSGHRIPEEEP